MTTQKTDVDAEAFANSPVPRAASETKLKVGAVGLFGVLFMALANAAPITAMSGNVPIGVGYGNGNGMPGSFLFGTIVLVLFTIGFVAMARHVTTTGAFFGFISQGLGQIWGMAAGYVATMAYIIFEGSLIGIFAWFAEGTIKDWFNVDVNWFLIAAIGIVVIGVLGYYDINIAAKILGFFLVCEVLLLAALSFSVLFRGGGPNGLVIGAINPANGFQDLVAGGNAPGSTHSLGVKGVAAGTAAIGIFFAFWSWVGFETTAVYGEESRNPRRIVPRATLIAVIGLGLFYTFVSWMAVSGNGLEASIARAAGSNPIDFFQINLHTYLGEWAVRVFQFLTVTGSFACALAFHNAASRYIYAFGREAPSLQRSLGATHVKHGSPHFASAVQSVITMVITILFFAVKGSDSTQAAYIYEYGILAVIGTMAILFVQALCSISVIWYFHVRKVHHGNPITTLVIPLLGTAGMVYAIILLFEHLDFAGGAASGSPLFKAGPYLVAAIFVLGVVTALWIRARSPERYQAIGRTVLEEAHERG